MQLAHPPDTQPAAHLDRIPLTLIDNHPTPARHAADDGIGGLAASIAASGQAEPVTVTPTPDGRYQLQSGARRVAAARLAGGSHIDAVVRTYPDDDAADVDRLNLHFHTLPLTPLEQGGLLRDYIVAHPEVTQQAVAAKIGLSGATVSNRLALLDLPDNAHAALDAGTLTVRDAEHLVRLLPNTQLIAELLVEIEDPQVGWPNVRFAVDFHLNKLKERRVRAYEIDRLTKLGVRLVEQTDYGRWVPPQTVYVADLDQVNPRLHEGASCRAVFVDTMGHPVEMCVQPDLHHVARTRTSPLAGDPHVRATSAPADTPQGPAAAVVKGWAVWDTGSDLHPVGVRVTKERLTAADARALFTEGLKVVDSVEAAAG